VTDADPLWYKDAIIYEVHVRAFHDSRGDGIGDFGGLTRKLDYLQDLGITAIWLLPFYPSPLKDDGYDIADYTDVHRHFGRLSDFQELLDGAHRRDIRVITELVLNHTSDQHPWFQRARRAPAGSVERDFYVWSDTPDKFLGARIIFKDFETSNWTWDPVAKAYYWHRFYSHQPDLNFDNPAVWEAVFPVVDFWLGMGVDGMRLDAIPYLYEREGTNCENLTETHAFLKALRAHIDQKFSNRMFLAEANQWPEDAVAYFGAADECHMAFHFPLMPRLFMSLHQEDRFPILDILAQTPVIPETCQWCLFLRNHDELTLEMVTDEERDYMYRAYADDPEARINLGIRHRLAPLLSNDRRRIELMNMLLFSLPGTPSIYYGDEIGMGDNIYLGDRNGVRTPMQWSSDRNAGFSRANPQRLYLPVIIDPEYHFEAVNVEAQQNNPSSLLWWMKRLIALRKRFKAFGRGSLEFLRPDNPKIFAFIRRYQDERILIVANLSRFVQHAEFDLSEFRGLVPEEIIGHSLFPPIGDQPYLLTLGPHGFYGFSLEPAQRGERGDLGPEEPKELPVLTVPERWERWLFHDEPDRLELLLPDYLQQRQPLIKSEISSAQIQQVFPLRQEDIWVYWLLLRVEYRTGLPERMLLPLTVISEEDTGQLLDPVSVVALARLAGGRTGLLCEALAVPKCTYSLLATIRSGRTYRLGEGELAGVPLARLAEFTAVDLAETPPTLLRTERFNASVAFGSKLILKTFRRLEEGINPDLEMNFFLSQRQSFAHVAPVLGYIEYRRQSGQPITLALLQEYVANQGTAWQLSLDHLSLFFERVAALSKERPREGEPEPAASSPLAVDALDELIGSYLHIARQLGERTGTMHQALAADRTTSAFAPELFSQLYQRSVYQSMRNLTFQLLRRLGSERSSLNENVQEMVDQLLAQQEALLQRFRRLVDQPLSGWRIRCHGDYHLAQLLYTGNDFVIIDFEGDPEETIGERHVKRTPFRDVASMLYSFDYVVHTVLYGLARSRGRAPGAIRTEDRVALEPWARKWCDRVSREFLAAYFDQVASAAILPTTVVERQILLDVFLLAKSMDEIRSELNQHSERLVVPLRGLLRMLAEGNKNLIQ
jgi:maltose alpha-D-glucosyltransferase / alpha-amylase